MADRRDPRVQAVAATLLHYEYPGVPLDETQTRYFARALAVVDALDALTGLDAIHPLRAQAAIAAFPYNLARGGGMEAREDARRERVVADSIRDADALLAGLSGKVTQAPPQPPRGIEWRKRTATPEPDRRLLFHVVENGRGETHIGFYRERVFTQGGGMCFRSDACDVTAEHLEFGTEQVWCWAYEPEIPT